MKAQSTFTYFIRLLSIGLLLHACSQKPATDASETTAQEDVSPTDPWQEESTVTYTLSQQVDVLLDSIIAFQKKAAASEHEKINSTLMFIDEIEALAPTFDREKLAEIKTLQSQLAQHLYTASSMQDTTVMLRYDALCDELATKLSEFKETVPDFQRYSRAELLLTDILKANYDDFFIRKDYNFYVQDFNRLLEEKQQALQDLGSPYDTLQKFLYFYEDPAL